MMFAIEKKQPINLIRFKELVNQLKLSHRIEAADIRGIKIKGDRYCIEYIHPTIKCEILNLISALGDNRISAAKQNLSHQHKVIGSFILICQQSSPVQENIPPQMFNHPQVVIFDEHGNFEVPLKLSKFAVIVENRQLFLNLDKMQQFLMKYTHVPCDQPIDFIYGTGNEIPNSLHQKFLNQYEHLYLCFDLDLGGLKIAKNLSQLLPTTNMTFVQPYDIQQRLAQVVQSCSVEELEKLAQFALSAPAFIQPYVQLMCNTQRRLEQESFLI